MPRIRTIKPEFPQSESMGTVSRDARLLFILLWTICDDEGRGRGSPKMLASLLYPYDDDAPRLIDGWLGELERAECIELYRVNDASFFQVTNWRSHQKIDKPTPSKFPSPSGDVTSRMSERDIEDALFGAIKSAGEVFGEAVIDIQRQVRVGSYYLDLVVACESKSFVIEVKRDRLTAADLAQVLRYSQATGAIPVLAGQGLGPQFPVSECRSKSVAAIGVATCGAVTLLIQSDSVKECSLTLDIVRERQVTLGNAPERYGSDLGPGRDQDQGPGMDQDGDEPAVAGTPPQPKTPKAAKETKPKPSECKFPVFPCSGNDGQWEAPPELLAELSAIYPAVDADAELRKAHFWIMSNIAKRKSSSGYPRYLGTWFKKAQDDASRNGRQAVARAVVAAPLPALTLPSEFTN